jgi:hypothetical protein
VNDELEGFERKRSWPTFKTLSRHLLGSSEENRDKSQTDSRSPGRNSNPGPPEFESGMLTNRPRRLVDFAHSVLICFL